MQADPISERQRLIDTYRLKNDEELRDLAADFNDLTDAAQEVLRGELHSRGLPDPQALRPSSNAPQLRQNDPAFDPILGQKTLAFGARQPILVPDSQDSAEAGPGPHEYTWKTVLCECGSDDEARELSETLRQAGIDNWIDGGKTLNPYLGYAQEGLVSNLRILVAADQLEQAQAIAAQPIPPQIVDECNTTVPDYTPPVCPKCGAADPVLEGVDPTNTWHCEQCGADWTDPLPAG